MSVETVGVVALVPLAISVAAAVHQAAFPAEESWDAKALSELLAMPGAQGRLALAADGAPVGFALHLLVADSAELLTLAVIPERRRRGTGKALLDDFLECGKQFGAINAFLEVAEDNISALSLYKRAGFRFAARRPDYYHRASNIRVAAQVLSRPLT
jgi:ribosomal-protein-alanine N-acetyltransferase